jgi:pyrimidine operon attenuation protein/uracil phosphoribosyltransferase
LFLHPDINGVSHTALARINTALDAINTDIGSQKAYKEYMKYGSRKSAGSSSYVERLKEQLKWVENRANKPEQELKEKLADKDEEIENLKASITKLDRLLFRAEQETAATFRPKIQKLTKSCLELGVAKASIYRYYQSWKNSGKDLDFRMAKRAIASDPDLKAALVKHLGVTEGGIMAVLRQSRSASQLKIKLGQTDNEKVDVLIGRTCRATLEAIVVQLGSCRTLEERAATLQVISRRMGVTEAQLISQLVEMNNKLRTDALLRKVIKTTPNRYMGVWTSRSKDQGQLPSNS